MISYVIELVNIFEKYKTYMFKPLVAHQKHLNMDDTVLLAEKLKIFGDMPDDTSVNDMVNPEKNLCAIVSLYERATSSAWMQFGDISAMTRTPVAMALWTADPMLREEIHISLTEFFMKNGATLVHGRTKTGVSWELDNLQVQGYGGSPDDFYSRRYTLWMKSMWLPGRE